MKGVFKDQDLQMFYGNANINDYLTMRMYGTQHLFSCSWSTDASENDWLLNL